MTYWGTVDIVPRILVPDTRWRWVVSFMPQPLYSRNKASDTYWIEDWVGPRGKKQDRCILTTRKWIHMPVYE
jgi:hypothetical protein